MMKGGRVLTGSPGPVLRVLTMAVALLLLAGCSQAVPESVVPAPASQDSPTAEETDVFPVIAGTWENPEGSVFRVITFRSDGTADTVNYGDLEVEATWTLEDGYLKVETDGGESWGSPVEWVSDTEFAWANESGTWVLVP